MNIYEKLEKERKEYNALKQFTKSQGFKYCEGEDDILPLTDFYSSHDKKGNKTYTTLSKQHHQAQLEKLKIDRQNKDREPYRKQETLF